MDLKELNDEYKAYIKMYGRLASGGKFNITGYREELQIAASLAAQDVKAGIQMRSQSDFIKELNRLAG